MAGSDKLPKFADWIVTAGGTQSHESQDGYHVRGPFGEYHLWPIAGHGGRRRGSYYIVQFANTPHFDPDQRGLWRDLGRASSPRRAYAIAKTHHEDVRARRTGRRTNPIRSKAQWRALAAKTRRGEISKRQWREMVRETKRGYRRLPERVGRRVGKRKRRPARARTRNSGYPHGHHISQKEWEHLDAIHELRMRRRMSAIVAAGDPDAVKLLEKGLVEIEYNTLYEDPHLRRKDLPGWALVLTPAGKLALESIEGSGLSAHYADIRKKRWRGRLGHRPRKANRKRKRR